MAVYSVALLTLLLSAVLLSTYAVVIVPETVTAATSSKWKHDRKRSLFNEHSDDYKKYNYLITTYL